jgi:hypothetical protein
MALIVRTLTAHETDELKRLAQSRAAPHRLVQGAGSCGPAAMVRRCGPLPHKSGFSALRVRAWINRFNRDSLAGLADAPRSGRARRPDEIARGTVIAPARTKPRSLGLPFALGILARLQQAL